MKSTDQKNVLGTYHPHKNISRYLEGNEFRVFCFDCGHRWYHPRTENKKNLPKVCQVGGPR